MWVRLVYDHVQDVSLSGAHVKTLEQQQLSKGDIIDPQSKNALVISLWACFSHLPKRLTNLQKLFRPCEVEENEVGRIHFEVIDGLKSVHHLLLATSSLHIPFVEVVQGQDAYAILVDGNIVVALRDVECGDLGLPKLERLVSEQSHRLIAVNIVYIHIVSVVTNSFVRNNQLFVTTFLVSHHGNIRISDVKFRLQLQKEVKVFGLLLVESN